MCRKFTTRNQDFIAGLPVETLGHCGEPRGCSRGDGDLLGGAPDQFRERCSNAVRQFEIDAFRQGMREFLPFERLRRRKERHTRQRALCRDIEVRNVFEFKPFFSPIRHYSPSRKGSHVRMRLVPFQPRERI